MNTSEIDQAQHEAEQRNPENLREIERVIASAVIITKDGHVLMGRKDPAKGGVYPDLWHIPGGGVEEGESLEDAVIRETQQETGLVVVPEQIRPINIIGHGETTKTLPTGERVWCNMQFNRFEVRLDKNADEVSGLVKPGDDLVELRIFPPQELADVDQIPGGREFFQEAGYIQPT